MTAIITTVCIAIAVLVLAVIFVPGVGSALAAGFGLAFFRVLGENRQKRIEARRVRWRRQDNPAPDVPASEKDIEPATPEQPRPRRFRLRRRVTRDE
jgi:hypothetical protein